MMKMVALGVGIGTVIDLFTRSNETIYLKGGFPASRVALQPRKGGAALRWTTAW